MRPKVWRARSSSSSSAPTPTWSACRSTKPWRCLPAKGFRPTAAGSIPRKGLAKREASGEGRVTAADRRHAYEGGEGGGHPPGDRAALTFAFAENVDLDGAVKHLPPSL